MPDTHRDAHPHRWRPKLEPYRWIHTHTQQSQPPPMSGGSTFCYINSNRYLWLAMINYTPNTMRSQFDSPFLLGVFLYAWFMYFRYVRHIFTSVWKHISNYMICVHTETYVCRGGSGHFIRGRAKSPKAKCDQLRVLCVVWTPCSGQRGSASS